MIDDLPASPSTAADRAEIEGIVRAFFAAFTSGPDSSTRLFTLRSMFLPQAVIIRTCGMEPVVYGVEGFIREWELSGCIDLFGDIAHWFGTYAKAGVQDGAPFTGRGTKSLQFVRTTEGWRISAAAWDDERDGLTIGQG